MSKKKKKKTTNVERLTVHEDKLLDSLLRQKTRKAVTKQNKRLKKLKIVFVNPDELSPNSYNPNRQGDAEFKLLLQSMIEDGFTQPIVALKDGTIVDGEHRWRAGRSLIKKGMLDKLPVVYTDMTPEQMRIATLRHNRARGSEDYDLVQNVFKDLRELGATEWAADSLALSDKEMELMLNDDSVAEMFASEEYSEAWTPGVDDSTNLGRKKTATTMTAVTADRMRVAERKLKKAKTAEERKMLRDELNTFTIRFHYTGDEADTVRSVLGDDSPADKLLEICKSLAPKEDSDGEKG